MRVEALVNTIALRDAWTFRRGTLWMADLNELRAGSLPRSSIRATYSQVKPEHMSQFFATVGQMDPITPGALKRRLDSGSRCYGAWLGESLVSYGWLTFGTEWVGEFERELQIPVGDAYVWDCATLPEYRRTGLFSGLLAFMVSDLLYEELQRLWIISVISAPAMSRGIRSAGFHPVADLIYLRVFNLCGLFMRPVSGAASEHFVTARQIFAGGDEVAYGTLLVSKSENVKPPVTHI